MGAGDAALKEFFARKERLADLFNAVLANGQQVIKPEYISLLHPDKSSVQNPKKGERQVDRVEADVLAKVVVPGTGTGAYVFVVDLEDQLYEDYIMVFRALHGDIAGYLEQIRKLKKKHAQAHDLKGDEVLSGVSAADDIWPVITIVLYFGKKPWTAPLTLRDAVSGPDWLRQNVSDWPMILVQVTDTGLVFQNEANRNLFRMLGIAHNPTDRKQAMEELIQMASDIGAETDEVETVEAILGRRLVPRQNEEGGSGVHQFVIEYGDEREADGIAIGRRDGIAEGEAKGKAEGIIMLSRLNGCGDEQTASNLMLALKVTHDEARKLIRRYDAESGQD